MGAKAEPQGDAWWAPGKNGAARPPGNVSGQRAAPGAAAPARYFASGSGRSWKCTTLLGVPLPVSVWNGARVP